MAEAPSTQTNSLGGRQLAAVTGASSGIGLELARQFAEHGFALVICAEDDMIHEVAASLNLAGGEVRSVQVDLRQPAGVQALYAAIREDRRPLAALALNAGVGWGGAFVDTDIRHDLEIVDLNITSTLRLAKRVLRDMVEAGSGRVLVTSSVASEMPGSFQATYNASKSFLQSFVQALQNELKDTGVTLTSLMPGPTDTFFFERADMMDTTVGQADKDDPVQVARQGYEAMMAGEARVVGGGLKTRVQEAVSKVVPDRAKAALHRRMAEPDSDT